MIYDHASQEDQALILQENSNSFSCYLIGDDNLLIKCAAILLSKGHHILGIQSSNPVIETWSKNHQIPLLHPVDLEQRMHDTPCDYLFSINSQHILPDSCLNLPKYFCINYHDALLPKYAGIHASSWAILNNETLHGVSWHIMTKEIDAGDILKQSTLQISKDETALTLNLKCFELAISSFVELIEELVTHNYQRTSQVSTQRTYFGRHKKPPYNGWINWDQPAHTIDALCRALYFGKTTNRLATAKISLAGYHFVVDAHYVTEKRSFEPPGTVVDIGADSLCISTQTYDLSITAVRAMNGTVYAISELSDKYEIKPGTRLNVLDSKTRKNLEKSGELYSQYESFWVTELKKYKGVKFPFFTPITLSDSLLEYTLIDQVYLDEQKIKKLSNETVACDNILLTLCLIYLHKLSGHSKQSIGFSMGTNQDELLVNQVPMNFRFRDDMDFLDCIKHIQHLRHTMTINHGYLKDIYCRYPELMTDLKFFPITVIMVEQIKAYSFADLNAITLIIELSTQSIHIFVNEAITNANLMASLKLITGHIKELLHSLTADEQHNQSIAQLNFLTKRERKKILYQWNATDRPFPQGKTVHQLFEEQVLRTPQNIAIEFNERSLTYEELNQQSNQFAHYLRKQGVKPETLVALSLKRNVDMVIAVLGVLKAGGAYVPIDPDYPEQRIKYILDDCKALIFLTQRSVANRFTLLPDSSTKLVILEEKWPIIHCEPTSNPPHLTQSNQLIYLIYTSGSTGKPKGVLVEHKGVVNCLFSIAEKIDIQTCSKFLAVTSLSFDVAALDYFLPLSFGATVSIASEEDKVDAEKLVSLLNVKKITAMQATPNTWQMLIIAGWMGARDFKILTAGESLTTNLSDSLQKRGKVFNIYGPTETTIYATLGHIKKSSRVNIGKPIANTKAYVLSKHMGIQPIGVTGELYISGIGLARGYLNRTEQTKSSFLENILIDGQVIKVYKTGDLVQWSPDGSLYFIGRGDNQVKINGYRIELGEIEQALLSYPDILNAIVLPFEKNGRKKLIAYLQNNKGIDHLNTDSLRNDLAKKLPEFMVPKTYIELESFPLNTNGKIDRNKLLQIYRQRKSNKNNALVVFKSKIEAELYGIWHEILDVHPLFVKDNFFSLGGDSILAMQIVSKARQCGIYFTVKQIFLHPTIRELATVIKDVNPVSSLEENKEGIFPLAPIQSWFFEQNFVKKEFWSQTCFVDILKPIDVDILYQSLKMLISEHDALRLRFCQENNTWKQYYGNAAVLFQTEALSSVPSQETWDELSKKWQFVIQDSFNLETGPLIGAVLFTVNQIPQKLLMVIHHLIVDGVSWRILIQDLYNIYDQNTQKQFTGLSHTTASYKSWILQLYQYTDSSLAENDKIIWLNNKHHTPLVKDFNQHANLEQDAITTGLQLSLSETQALLKRPLHDASLRINDILLTILAKSFEQWTGNNSLLIDMESHGREELESNLNLSRTLGWFTSFYPLYLIWPENTSIDITLDAIKKQIQAIPNNGIMYGVLRYLTQESKRIHKVSHAEISFNYWGIFQTQLENDTFKLNAVQLVSAPSNTRSYIIDVNCWVVNKQFCISFTYNKTHFRQETISALAQTYMRLMRAFLSRNTNIYQESLYLKSIEVTHKKSNPAYPLAPIQKGMLFHILRNPESEAYCIQLYWSFRGNLDAQIYQQAWEILLHKYDVFRTGFFWDSNGEPTQVIHDDATVTIRQHDWSHLSATEVDKRWEIFLEADRQIGFNLTSPPLLRLTLISIAEHAYLMSISLPHLILDGWCIPILFRELSATYQTLSAGNHPDLIVSWPYSSYIQWLNQQHFKVHQHESFWRHYLLGFHTPTDLVIAKNHSTKKLAHAKYKTAQIELSTRISSKVIHFAKKHHLTLNTIFQGLWGILLARYSQTNDIIFGITLSTRSQELIHSENMMGLFINTIPLRIQASPEVDTLTYLNRLQINFTELQEYRYTALTDIETWSDIASDSNLFETVMVFENYPVDAADKSLFDSRKVLIHDPSHYPLVFYVTPGKRYTLRVNYNCTIITEADIDRLMGHLQTLLVDILNHPKQVISKLSLLSDIEYKQFLDSAYTPVETTYFSHAVPHQVFEQLAQEYPESIALIFENQQLSYRELNERANQLAHYLHSIGVRSESIVALCMERSIDMLVGILGILKSGGAYLPIDPIYPDLRVEFLLQNSKTQHFVLQHHLFERLKSNIPMEVKIVLMDTADEQIRLYSKQNLNTDVRPDSLMYVMYTSGSTGKPKGVQLEHRNVLHLFNATNQVFDINKDDRWTLFHSIAFDFSVWEMWGALLYGGSLVIVPQKSIHADEFYQLLIKHKVTILSQTPSAFHQLAIIDNSLRQKLWLKYIIFDGEVLPPKFVKLWFKSHSHDKPKLINMYGITETTVHLTHCELSPEKLIDGRRYPIGKELPGVALYVLDENLQPVPIGIPGELYVGGPFLARGYLDKELTQKRFLNTSFDPKIGGRFYKTGDLAKRLDNGELDYLGRIDNQVKFRGYRIELDEITAWIEKYPGITHVVVMPQKGKHHNGHLVAYLKTKHRKPIEIREIKAFLHKCLPNYMIPDVFIFLDKMPLTSNGKIDKQALPVPDTLSLNHHKLVKPRTPVEKTLFEIWRKVLKIDKISVYDNFFDLGGHSLLALQLLLHIKQRFLMDLPVRTILDASTLAELATLITNNSEFPTYLPTKKGVSSCLVPLQSEGNNTPLFLIHPVGGTIFWYLPLIKHFGKDQPLYGIQDPSIEHPNETLFSSIEQMASFYIETIQSVQPKGPYLLGGASGGSIISFEMARQLLFAGEQVNFLGLLDGWVPHPEQLRHEEIFEATMRRQYNLMHDKFKALKIQSAESLLQLQWQRAQLLDQYDISPLDIQLTLFKANEISSFYQPYASSPFNHWENYTSYPVKLLTVPGDHETMFHEPHATALAQVLLTALQDIEKLIQNVVYSNNEYV